MIRDLDYRVSTNFKFKELIASSTADRLEINNGDFVTEEILDNAAVLAEKVFEPVRARWGSFSPNSWFRCEELEFAITEKSFFRNLLRGRYNSDTLELENNVEKCFAGYNSPDFSVGAFVKAMKTFGARGEGDEFIVRALCDRFRFLDGLKHSALGEYWEIYFNRKQHPKGMAGDYEIVGTDNLKLYDWVREQLQFDQHILEFHRPEKGPDSGWVHTSWNNHGVNRQQLLRY